MPIVPALDPTKVVLYLDDRSVVLRRDDPAGARRVIRSPGPRELGRILAAVDGRRSLDEVCAALADEFDPDSVAAVLRSLRGIVVVLDEPGGAPPEVPLAGAAIAVVGRGRLATGLAAALAPATVTRIAEAPAADLAARLRGLDAIVAAHDGVANAEALAVNEAALAAGVPCVHVWGDGAAITVGPTTVPGRSGCLECAQLSWYFRSDQMERPRDALDQLALLPLPESIATDAAIDRATREVVRELRGLLTGRPYPARLGTLLRIPVDAAARSVDIVPSSSCSSCHGCNAGPVRRDLAGAATAAPPPLEDPAPAADAEPGRTVSVAEARARAERALAQLGVRYTLRGYSAKLRERYPELQAFGFAQLVPDIAYRREAPFVVTRVPELSFGKGASTEQAVTSAMYEWLERATMMYRGGVEIVRAPYAEVRAEAVDMAAYTHGGLAVPDGGPRIAFDPARPIDWVWGRCLRTGRPILMPARTALGSLVRDASYERLYVASFRGLEMEMPIRSSSGVAAGGTREEAVLQGLYEIVEHDARLIHGRAGVGAPTIDPDSIDDPGLRSIVEGVRRAGFDLVLRYLTLDIAVPVVEAYLTSRRDYTFHRVAGWGADRDPVVATRRAITEAVQAIAANECLRDQTFAGGFMALTNSFVETQFILGRTLEARAFADLPRPPAGPRSLRARIDEVVAQITAALPATDLCYFAHPMGGLEGVHVTAVLGTHLACNVHARQIVQDRVRHARRRPGGEPIPLEQLYHGELKF